MPSYIVLGNFTKQGIQNIKESPDRLEAAKKAFNAFGAELQAFYLTMGQFDGVWKAEAPDDETMAKVALAIGAAGNVKTETLRAFTEEEYRDIIAALP